jgi:uncharacterized protein
MASEHEELVLAAAIRDGDLSIVREAIRKDPGLATEPLRLFGGRTALHVVADWPGYFPNGPQIVDMLIGAGADPNFRDPDKEKSETPLHWAASSDDVDVARALIDGGAALDIPDGSIGTPLENAVGYGCWRVAHLLVARGAAVDRLWVAAALGLMSRLQELLRSQVHSGDDVSQAFWHACSGGQRRAAEALLAAGADWNWVPDYGRGTGLDAARGHGTGRENLITWLQERGAPSVDDAA